MALLIALLVAAGAAGCNPGDFGTLRDEAPVLVIDGDGAAATAIAGYAAELDGETVGRLAITGGPNTPFRVFRAWNGERVRLGESPVLTGCATVTDCPAGHGAAVAGLPRWRAGTSSEARSCVAATAPAEGTVIVRCETSASMVELLRGEPGIELGASIAALPDGDPVGAAVLGAPFAGGGLGAVWLLPQGQAPVPLTIDATLPGDANLGSAVAAAPHPDGTLIAATAPGAGMVVVAIARDEGGTVIVGTRGCITGTTPGFGAAVAAGDLDGDGVPEVVVGSRSSTGSVAIYDGDGLGAAGGGCAEWSTPPRMLSCLGLVGSDCDDGLGAALATGDVDGDGSLDLIVGAPDAVVAGDAGAGAVDVFFGPMAPGAGRRARISPSTHRADDAFGAAVTAVPAGDRVIPVAGAPGSGRVMVIQCILSDGETC